MIDEGTTPKTSRFIAIEVVHEELSRPIGRVAETAGIIHMKLLLHPCPSLADF